MKFNVIASFALLVILLYGAAAPHSIYKESGAGGCGCSGTTTDDCAKGAPQCGGTLIKATTPGTGKIVSLGNDPCVHPPGTVCPSDESCVW
jgi:hypothetical protein